MQRQNFLQCFPSSQMSDIIQAILENKLSWNVFKQFIRKVMSEKWKMEKVCRGLPRKLLLLLSLFFQANINPNFSIQIFFYFSGKILYAECCRLLADIEEQAGFTYIFPGSVPHTHTHTESFTIYSQITLIVLQHDSLTMHGCNVAG